MTMTIFKIIGKQLDFKILYIFKFVPHFITIKMINWFPEKFSDLKFKKFIFLKCLLISFDVIQNC